jgi:RNA-directed DNA polymerase
VTPIKDVPFLGFHILWGKIRVSKKARIKFKEKIRELTRRNNPLSMYQITQELNEYLRAGFHISGFKSSDTYFGILIAGYEVDSDPCS